MSRNALELTILISGKLDNSLSVAITDSQKQVSSLSKLISNVGKVGLVAMGTAFAGTAVAIAKCTEESTNFENGMTKIYKYVDGLADETGAIGSSLKYVNKELAGTMFEGKTYAENVDIVKDAITDLSLQVPLAVDEIQDMFAKLGQSGVNLSQLISYDENGVISGYVNDVAKISAAFDMEAASVADLMMQAENAFGYSHEQVMDLFDAINYTAANSPTTAEELTSAVFRSLAMGEISGLGASGTVALTDALLSAGLDESRAATTSRNMLSYLSLGSSGTKSQQDAFASIGLDPNEVASRMQTEGFEMLNEVFDRVRTLDREDQIQTLKNLFNLRAIEGGSMIANNPELLMDAFALASETEEGRGYNSIQREYDIETASPEALSQLITNAKETLARDVGDSFLDVKTEAMRLLLDVLLRLHDVMPDLSNLASQILPVIRDAFDTIADALVNAGPYIQQFIDFISASPGTAVAGIGGLATAFGLMTQAPTIEKAIGGAGSLLSSVGGTAANLILGKEKKYPSGSVARSGGLLGLGTRGIGKYLSNVKSSAGALANSTGIPGAFSQILGLDKREEGQSLYDYLWGHPLKDMAADIDMYSPKQKTPSGIQKIASGIWQTGSGALTKVGSAAAPVVSGLSSLGGGAMNILGGGAQLAGAVWGPFASGFMSLFSAAAPIVGLIGTIIALFSILGDHMEDIRGIVGDVFGEQGLEVFDSFTGKLGELGGFIDGLFNGGLADALSGVREMITGVFGDEAGTTFDNFVGILQSVLGVVGQVVTFGTSTVKPIIEEIFRFLVENVMPIIINTFNAAAPIISGIITNLGTAIMGAMNLIGSVIQAVMPIAGTLITTILGVLSGAAPVILGAIETISGGISEVIESIQEIFNGIIEFIDGVFTGDWEQAWQGVQDIFGGIFDGLVTLVKTPLNTVIGFVNSVIDGINALSITIPDWVPEKGGQSIGFNIPHIPELAAGGFTNGVSIAGEAGQEAVISFDPAYRASNIATWLEAGRLLGIAGQRRSVSLEGMDGTGRHGSTNGQTWNVTYSPQITIQGSADRATLDKALSDAKSEFESWFYQMQKRQRRVAY